MTTFFGVSTTWLALASAATLGAMLAVLAARALRWPIFFRLGMRQLPRRPVQTLLVVSGLALSSTLISASLATGDTLTHALRSAAVGELGRIDEVIVASEPPRPGTSGGGGGGPGFGSAAFFPESERQRIASHVAASPALRSDVAALAPAIRRDCTVVDTDSRQTSAATVIGIPADLNPAFGQLHGPGGALLASEALDDDGAYVNDSGTGALGAAIGHALTCTVAGVPLRWTVRGVAARGGLDSSSLVNVYVALRGLQGSLQVAGVAADVERPVNQVLVANHGDALSGADRTERVSTALRSVLVDGTSLLEAQELLKRPDLRAALAVRRGTLNTGVQRRLTELLEIVDTQSGRDVTRSLGRVFQDEGLRAAVLTAARDVSDTQLAPQLSSALGRALNFRVMPVKQQVLELAERAGNTITTIFLLFSLLSIAASVLLVFLIFSLLAASRRSELGMTRALGSERGHLVAMFTYEGAAYAALAAVAGVPAGLAISRGLLGLLLWAVDSGVAGFTGAAVRLTDTVHWHVEPRSIVLAATLGGTLTLMTVATAAWQVSRLTIVAAIRDLPEPPRRLRAVANWWWVPLLAVAMAASLAGRARVVTGIEVFGVSGLALMAGGVWAVAASGNRIANAVTWLLSRTERAAPAARLATAYALRQPIRTGLTMAMFGLVVMMLTVMQVVTAAAMRFHADANVSYGGWQIEGQLRALEPQAAEAVAVSAADRSDLRAYVAGAGLRTSGFFALLQLAGPAPGWGGYQVVGIDRGFARRAALPLQARASGYSDDRAVWEAVAMQPGLGVIDANALPNVTYRGQANVATSSFSLWGVTDEDTTFSPPFVWIANPAAPKLSKVQVIGLIDRRVVTAFRGLHVSLEQLAALGPPIRPPTTRLYFQTAAEIGAARSALGAAYFDDGLETVSLLDRFVNESGPLVLASRMLQLFVGLGLIVGVAALAVVSSRAALERRQLIGVLRAIGFERGAIARQLLLESALVVVVGSALGIGCGIVVCQDLFAVQFFDRFQQGMRIVVPWGQIAVTLALTCSAALLATWLPARQASRIPPVAALREA